MKASSCLAILLVAGGLLIGMAPPSQAAEQLVGGYSEASVTNTEVVAAAQFAVKALAAMPERRPDITLVEILSASQQVVAGMNYRLRMKLKVDGKDRDVEVVVWRKLNGEYQLTSRVDVTPPDEAILSRLRKGMLLMQFEQVVGKTAKPRPNPTPHDSVADYDFDGWCIIADVDNSPVAPAATVRDYRVFRDGLTVTQREAERARNWAAWVHAHPRNTNEAEFVYTVGTDTKGVPMQQVEWLYRKADLKEPQCPIWAGSLVNMGMEENGAVRVQCDKTALPDEQKWHPFILKGNIVAGWLKKEAIIKVKISDWKMKGGKIGTNNFNATIPAQLEPLHVTTPKGFTAVTQTQKALVERVRHLTRGMSVAEVKEHLGHPAEESPNLLFYHLAEDGSGGHYVTVRLGFNQRGLATAEFGFGHVSIGNKVSE